MTENGSKEKVAALRAELSRRALTGFIIPHADEYQNEYLPAYAERLAWLTGFTGSAGTAVVLHDEATIFVDGRYVLQVQNQVDRDVFVCHHLADWPFHDWISSVLKPNQKLGYDPWLHTTDEVEKLRAACERVNAELVACDSNPLDAIWHDRPGHPITPAVLHPLQYSGKESHEKREEIARKLKSDRIDGALITAPDSIAWLLNIRGGDVSHTPLPLGFVLLSCDGSAELFIDQRKVDHALTSHLGPSVTLHPQELFALAMDKLGEQRSRVLCDPAKSASWFMDRLARAGAVVVKGDDPCLLPKACKNDVEIQGARQAHKRDGAAVCRFLAWLSSETLERDVTEIDAEAYLETCRRDNELWQDLSFPTISGFGPNGAVVHYRSTPETNRRLEAGSLYLVDSGAQYLDGTTDITRTIAIGPPTEDHRDRYTRVLKGHVALATARFPKGTSGAQLDVLARRPLWDVGLDYDHGTGHGVGSYLGVHEGPQRISKFPQAVALQPGMIVSNEPGYYKAGEYGIRIENLVVVVSCQDVAEAERELLRFDTLTVVPFDTVLIQRSLLTPEEIDWINDYHRYVYETVAPLVDQPTLTWLKQATMAI